MTDVKRIIGREDKVDFPELDLHNISVKIDTGAFTSAIHCSEIEEKCEDGKYFLQFRLLDELSTDIFKNLHKASHYTKRSIKSSFGDVEERYVIETSVIIYEEQYSIELSLTNRDKMNVPILLGRRFINKKFIVDPTKKNISYKQKNKTKI